MKYFTLFLLLLNLSSCANYTKESKEPFQITEASYNEWFGGQPGVSGIKVILVYKSKDSINFQNIFFANKSAEIIYKTKEDKKLLLGFIDTSKPSKELILDSNPVKEQNNPIPVQLLPFKIKDNQAVVSYKINNQTHYFLIKELKKLKTDYYP